MTSPSMGLVMILVGEQPVAGIRLEVFMHRFCQLAALALSVGALSLSTAAAQQYKVTGLVADQSGVAAATDLNLVNPWGLSRSSTTPWWASDNGTGLATLYDGTGAAKSLVVTIPTGDPNVSSTGTPTGTVFNGSTGFVLANGKPAAFMFVTEDGTVSAWNSGTSATIKVNTKSASVFKGAALATLSIPNGSTSTFLYVADFRKGRIQVYDSSFQRVGFLSELFRDEFLPRGYAPFNIQNIGGELYVTFARQDDQKHDEVDGPGKGYVDVFSPFGRLVRRLEHSPWLNAPWGLAMAPGDFGIYSHDLLVGQFGSGNVAVYDPVTGRLIDVLRDASNAPVAIDGLWDISFGGDSTTGSGPATTLYFAAGSDGEKHGLFGTITPIQNTLGNSQ